MLIMSLTIPDNSMSPLPIAIDVGSLTEVVIKAIVGKGILLFIRLLLYTQALQLLQRATKYHPPIERAAIPNQKVQSVYQSKPVSIVNLKT